MSQQKEDRCIIHMWSAPRSLSTCTMYSFAQRPDTKVYDEPLTAHWLHVNPQLVQPYDPEFNTEELWNSAIKMQEMIDYEHKPIVFAKHIGMQLIPEIDKSYLFSKERNPKHVFLLRNPLDCILSWDAGRDVHGLGPCSIEFLGFRYMSSLFEDIGKRFGSSPIILDSDLLKEQPKEMLIKLCAALEIPFYEQQLFWPAGPKPDIDGWWGKYWYASAHKSTGFLSRNPAVGKSDSTVKPSKVEDLTPSQAEVYKEALPFYEEWMKLAIKLDTESIPK